MNIYNILTLIFCFVIVALEIAARWKLFEIAGEDGWKAIIPFYHTLVSYDLCWKRSWGIAVIILQVLSWLIGGYIIVAIILPAAYGGLLGALQAISHADAFVMLLLALLIIASAASWIQAIRTLHFCASFDRNWLFALGMTFIPFVFMIWLAESPDVNYLGPSKLQSKAEV